MHSQAGSGYAIFLQQKLCLSHRSVKTLTAEWSWIGIMTGHHLGDEGPDLQDAKDKSSVPGQIAYMQEVMCSANVAKNW